MPPPPHPSTSSPFYLPGLSVPFPPSLGASGAAGPLRAPARCPRGSRPRGSWAAAGGTCSTSCPAGRSGCRHPASSFPSSTASPASPRGWLRERLTSRQERPAAAAGRSAGGTRGGDEAADHRTVVTSRAQVVQPPRKLCLTRLALQEVRVAMGNEGPRCNQARLGPAPDLGRRSHQRRARA